MQTGICSGLRQIVSPPSRRRGPVLSFPPMPLTPENITDDAIRVLAEAVHCERVPGIVEFRLLERALETAVVTPTAENLALAAAAFDALDHDFRQRIIDRAHGLAQAAVGQRHTR